MIFEEAYSEFKELEVDRDAKYNTEYTTEQIEEYKTHLLNIYSTGYWIQNNRYPVWNGGNINVL